MRGFACLIALGLSLGACQQTDAASAQNAGGSVNIVPRGKPTPPAIKPGDSGPTPPTDDGDADGGKLTPTQQAVPARDAASGLPTGKRQHKPVTVIQPD